MTEAPMLAIYMITYNHEDYIDQAIASVINQNTHFSFRLIIGDDGSKDGTFEKCLQWKEKFPDKIDVLSSTKNQGVFNNAGRVFEACIASGAKYIALLEGDDYWSHSDKLERQVTILESDSTIAASYHNTQFLYSDGHFKSIRKALPELLEMKNVVAKYAPFHTSSFVFRTEHFCRPAWFKNIDSVDLAMYVWHAQFGRFVGINEVMSVYRIHSTSLTASTDHHENFDYRRVLLHRMMRGRIPHRLENEYQNLIDFHSQKMEVKSKLLLLDIAAFYCPKDVEMDFEMLAYRMKMKEEVVNFEVQKNHFRLMHLKYKLYPSFQFLNRWIWKLAFKRATDKMPSCIVFFREDDVRDFVRFFGAINIPAVLLFQTFNDKLELYSTSFSRLTFVDIKGQFNYQNF